MLENQKVFNGMVIRHGNMEGPYFTQWRIDLLKELLGYVLNGLESSKGNPLREANIWYDAKEDFHMLSFSISGKLIIVRFYKVFSSKIDNADAWVACPRSQIRQFAQHLVDINAGF